MARFRSLDSTSCFMDGALFLRRPLPGGGMAYLRKDSECRSLEIALLRPEALFDRASRILKDSRSSKAAIADVPGLGSVFVKRHNSKGLRYTLRHLFRQARAFRCWQSAWMLEQLGVPTPLPLAAVAFRKTLILKSSYIITKRIEGLLQAPETVSMLMASEETRNAFLKEAFKHLALMHDCGITHGDLKFSNIGAALAHDAKKPVFAGFIDLDSMKHCGHELDIPARTLELARLTASFIAISSASGAPKDKLFHCRNMVSLYEDAGGLEIQPERLLEAANTWLDKT